MRVWALLDDRPGNRSQVQGVAEALGAGFQPKEIRYNALAALPNTLLGSCGLSFKADAFEAPWPDVAIGAGRRAAPVLRAIKRRNPASFCVQLMHPGTAYKHFDLVALPAHDRPEPHPKLIATHGAPHRLSEDGLAQQAAHWKSWIGDLPRPYIVLLAGGDSKHGRYSATDWTHLGSAASHLADQAGGSLLVSTSRRTGNGLRHLELALSAEHLYLHKWEEGAPEAANPYLGFLGLADAVIVTGESVSMLCEACFTGKPVLVFTSDRNTAPKFDRLHAGLYGEGYARPFGDDAALGWQPRGRLNPAGEIAAAIRQRLGAA